MSDLPAFAADGLNTLSSAGSRGSAGREPLPPGRLSGHGTQEAALCARGSIPQVPGRPQGARQRRVPLLLLWAVAAVVVLADQLTKLWALSRLGGGERIPLLGDVIGLVLVRNPGAAFSLAPGYTWVFSLVAVVVSAVVVRTSRRLASPGWAVVLGLVLGGAVGNLVDRLLRSPAPLRGHVVDFIDYGGLFVGNVADIAIVVAAAGIAVLTLRGQGLDGTRQVTGATRDPDQGAATSPVGTGGGPPWP